MSMVVRYQRAFDGRPSPCRFSPSCSEYALGAVQMHGAGRGAWL
ncbi:MAG: membrane protein insertion efficiency factor YidD, partial [Ilumatobacteraceae bacterium]